MLSVRFSVVLCCFIMEGQSRSNFLPKVFLSLFLDEEYVWAFFGSLIFISGVTHFLKIIVIITPNSCIATSTLVSSLLFSECDCILIALSLGSE